jgi:hypothetical protein
VANPERLATYSQEADMPPALHAGKFTAGKNVTAQFGVIPNREEHGTLQLGPCSDG